MDRESPILDNRKAANFVIRFPKTTDLTLRWPLKAKRSRKIFNR